VLLTAVACVATHLSLSSEVRVKLPQLLRAEELPEELDKRRKIGINIFKYR
jgi:hypothetical protein